MKLGKISAKLDGRRPLAVRQLDIDVVQRDTLVHRVFYALGKGSSALAKKQALGLCIHGAEEG